MAIAADLFGEAELMGDTAALAAHLDAMRGPDVGRFFAALKARDPVLTAHRWQGRAWAPGHGYMWLAADDLRKSLDADAARARSEKQAQDPRRTAAARQAMRMRAGGIHGQALAVELLRWSAACPEPLPPATVEGIARWANAQHA